MVYQIVSLRKAVIEVDDLVTGLQNRVVIAVQQIVSRKDRHTVTDVDKMCEEIREELRAVEDQWGVRILQFGFSNISPSPTTLEITQLEMLADEKLALYERMSAEGLSEEAAVALISGAVVSVHPSDPEATGRRRKAQDANLAARLENEMTEKRLEQVQRKLDEQQGAGEEEELDEDDQDDEDDAGEGEGRGQ